VALAATLKVATLLAMPCGYRQSQIVEQPHRLVRIPLVIFQNLRIDAEGFPAGFLQDLVAIRTIARLRSIDTTKEALDSLVMVDDAPGCRVTQTAHRIEGFWIGIYEVKECLVVGKNRLFWLRQ
jgi:hypothetical protein